MEKNKEVEALSDVLQTVRMYWKKVYGLKVELGMLRSF